MFRIVSLFIGTSFTVAVFTIFATSNVDSILGIPHKIYLMQRILIHMKSRSLCWICPSAPRVCSEPGGQKPVLSLSLDRIGARASAVTVMIKSRIIYLMDEHVKNGLYDCPCDTTWTRVYPSSLIARFMGPTWGPSGTDRTGWWAPFWPNELCYLGSYTLDFL